MVVLRSVWVACVLALAAVSMSACGSEEDGKKKKETTDPGGMMTPMVTAGSGMFGNAGEAGSPSTAPSTTPSTMPASMVGGSGGSAGSTAGSGGSAGSAGSSAGMTGSDAGVSTDAAMPAEEDPFGGLFDPGPVSCEGYLCLEAADCASLYPDENTTCKFTNCVDFTCVK